MANYQDNFAILFTADTGKLKRGIDEMLGKFSTTDGKVRALKSQFELMGKQWNSNGTDAEQLETNLADLHGGLENTTAPVTAMYAFQQLSQALNQVAGQLAGFRDHFLEAGQEIEYDMARLEARVGGRFDAQAFDSLGQDIDDLSVRIGVSSGKVINAIDDMLASGMDESQAIHNIEMASQAARVLGADIENIADLGLVLESTYGEASGGMENILDLAIKTTQNSRITGVALAQNMDRLASSAQSAGIPMDDLFKTVTVAGRTMKETEVFRGLNTVLGELQRETGKSAEAIRSLGYDSIHAAMEQKSLAEIAQELSDEGHNFNDVFGTQGAKVMRSLIVDTESAQIVFDEFANSTNTLNNAYEKLSDTNQVLTDQNRVLKESVSEAIGESMLPMQNRMLAMQNSLLTVFRDSDDSVKAFAGGLIFTTSKMGELISTAGSVSHNVYSIVTAVNLLKSANLATHFMSITKALWAKVGALKAAFVASQALQAVGLAGAIAFTTVQIVKLVGAVNDYREALGELEAGHNQRINNIKEQQLTEDEALSRGIANIQQLRKAQEDGESFRKRRNKNAIEELEAYGIEVNKNTDFEELHQKALEARAKIIEENKAKNEDWGNSKQQTAEQEKEDIEEIIELTEAELEAKKILAEQERAERERIAVQRAKELEQYEKQVAREIDTVQRKIQQIAGLEMKREIDNSQSIEEEFERREQYRRWEYENEIKSINETIKAYQEKNEELSEIEQEHLAELQELRIFNMESLANDIEELQQLERQAWQQHYDEIEEIEKESYDRRISEMKDYFALGQSVQQGGLKVLLNKLLDYVQAQLLAAIASSAAQSVLSGGILSAFLGAGLASARAGIGRLGSSVASFDVGGIPMSSGLGMLHRGDVVVNPTSDNPMMEKLVEKIGEKLNTRQHISLQIDKRTLGEAVVEDIQDQNRLIPTGNSVLDPNIRRG